MYPMPVCSVGGGDIFDCIQRGNIEQCIELIQNDRSILKQKGWGGFTPLHYAALHGNRPLVDNLLSNGADPNLTSDAGQTSFHFACRQGNIYIMHQMMQHGADLRLVDLQGKTSLHHAVMGGSIVAMHYLWETGMFRYSDPDMYHVSSLHLAASTSNTEVVRYLLRHQRCAVDALDQQGGTALHVAAERGGVEVCWTLLQRTGYRMLHQKNHNGLTPLDLSKQGKTFSPVLLDAALPNSERGGHTAYSSHGGRLRGAALLPAVSLAGQEHLHSVPPYDHLPKVSMVHFALVLGLLCKILTQDSGTLGRAESDPRFSCIADLVEKNEKPQRFCPYCELFQPDHSKHCKLCDVCVADYDHHCLFLNRCIGRGNHRLFLLFLLSMVTAHLLFLATATSYLNGKKAAGRHGASMTWSSWLPFLGAEFWVAVLAVMNALTVFWEAWLLREQFEAVAVGTTTYFRQCETVGRRRSLGQRWAAIFSFLLEGRRGVGRRQAKTDKTAIDI
ncbi:unnamed protein product [Lota lota]